MIASICGKVVHGKGLGHQYGMPTANIDCSTDNLKFGVYGGVVHYREQDYLCLINIGTRPSVDDDPKATVEAFLLDFTGNLYDEILTVDLLIYVRETRKFVSLQEVKEQVDKDIETIIRTLKN